MLRMLMGMFLAWLGCATACGCSGTPVDISLTGAVEKGPFVLGSTINISPLDSQLNPLGQVFNTKTTDDLGRFSVDFKASGVVSLEGSGYYYNEVSGGLSTGSLTLRALYQIQTAGVQSAFVNLITHLTYDRVKHLVSDGADFDAATQQAETELRAALGIGGATFMPGKSGIEMDILGGDNDANAYLFAVSAVIAQAGAMRATMGVGSLDGATQELINTTATDLANDGMLDAAQTTLYKQAQLALDPADVVGKLGARLTTLGSSAIIPNINRVLDSDADGIANAFDSCPWVENPMQQAITNQLCSATRYAGPLLKGQSVNGVLASDLDHNGHPSLVFYSYSTSGPAAASGQIVPYNPATGFGAPTDFSVAIPIGGIGSPQIAQSGDINGDGAPDLFLGGSNWMAVYPSNGLGGFGAGQALTKVPADMVAGSLYQGFNQLTIADFDGNGLADIAGISTFGKFLLQLQTAAGVWATPTEIFPVTLGITQTLRARVYQGDFNKDGKLDLVFVALNTMSDTTATAALGNGMGAFSALTPVTVSTGGSGVFVAAGAVTDVDADGKVDLLLVMGDVAMAQNQVYLLAGDGLGSLGARSPVAMQPAMSAGPAFIGAFTKDLRPSALVVNSGQPIVAFSAGNGFQSQSLRITANLGTTLAAVDMDQDGILDLISAELVNSMGTSSLGAFVRLTNK